MDLDKAVQEENQKEERTLFNPELTFCEGQTYLDFLLSNAKDDDEIEQIKDTINNYLEVVDDEIKNDDV
jgi:hypothetical protein